jgi:hypothetical protein
MPGCPKFVQLKHLQLIDVLRGADEFHRLRNKVSIDEYLRKHYPTVPWKLINLKIERAHDEGYLECGVSERTGWLTSKGKAKLQELEEAQLLKGAPDAV